MYLLLFFELSSVRCVFILMCIFFLYFFFFLIDKEHKELVATTSLTFKEEKKTFKNCFTLILHFRYANAHKLLSLIVNKSMAWMAYIICMQKKWCSGFSAQQFAGVPTGNVNVRNSWFILNFCCCRVRFLFMLCVPENCYNWQWARECDTMRNQDQIVERRSF